MLEDKYSCTSSNKDNPFGIEEDVFERWQELQKDSQHPERYILGKPHSDRARQFKPFAALRGYEELVEREVARANETHDFTKLEEGI